MQIGDGIALGLHEGRRIGHAGGGRGVDPRAVIDEIGVEAALLDVLAGKVAGELVNHGAHDFQVPEFLHAHIR